MSAPQRDSRRLFFALWPSDEFRAQIEATALPVVCASGGRPIPPRNFHVTLLFLGQIAAEKFPAIQQAGASLAGGPAFQLAFDGIESWGRKVLCLTSSTPPAAAIDLAERLRASLRSQLKQLDERPYSPHITLARDLPRVRPIQTIEPLLQQVKEYVLVESVRGAGGSHYSVLERWPLRMSA
ncbi:RNA 2',3'-cyclic phosphodiesterase [Peristeroidobacter agariperforans]|uniref:RNA 2',3'-cyclic phosphodiesterase n=1 Tax=Peristeroidobacter agariperforans TaxID=268404 RepID=UPI00101CDEFB|nr:RNA 2',3'-cyclic phosphodiesterase [Peristeroidobacter agariperforans]